MKYQFKISKFIQDKDIQSMPDTTLIETFKSKWLYRLQDRIFEFKDNENCINDDIECIIIWKEWCIPYKE